MIQFIAGLVVGVFVTIAAMNPTEAKRVANGAIDAVHGSYTTGAAVAKSPLPAQAVEAVKDTAKEVAKKVEQ